MKSLILVLVTFLSAATAVAQLPVYLPTQGLVGWYPFNNNTNDESGHGYDPTYIGSGVSLTSDRFGMTNMALDFNGNDYIRIPADSFPQNDRTVSLWFNVPDVSNRPILMGYGGAGYLGYGTSFFMGLNILGAASYHTQAHYYTNSLHYYYESEPLNEWIHFVITIAGTQISCYVNGELKETNANFSNSTYTSGRDLAFGVMTGADGIAPYTDANGGYLLGKLDDLGIWNRALSPAEIEQLHSGGLNSAGEFQSNSISVYPNPATGIMHLYIPYITSKTELQVINPNGQICKQTIIDTPFSETDISMLPAGVYILKLTNRNTITSRKILIH